jgi:hypothetical protein
MGKKISGAQKRKKRKEKEEAAKEAAADMERLKLGPTKIWTGLVVHHKDIFVSHVLPKLKRTDRFFFQKVNRESLDVLAYAGVNVSKLGWRVWECTSISTLEWAWNHYPWGEEDRYGGVMDQALFCAGVAGTNKLEFLKWAREVKQCEWDERTIEMAAAIGNLEMLKYCFSNDCPCDEKESRARAAAGGHLDCLRFLFDKMNLSRRKEDQAWFCSQVAETNKLEFLKWAREVKHCEWDERTIEMAAFKGNLEMLKYCFSNDCPCDEEQACTLAADRGHLDCLRFLFDKVKPSRRTEKYAALLAAGDGHMHILRYFVEERKISDERKGECVGNAAWYDRLDCLKYLVEEAKAPLNNFDHIAGARYKEYHECVNYLREKGSPEPTDEQYAEFAEFIENQQLDSEEENSD